MILEHYVLLKKKNEKAMKKAVLPVYLPMKPWSVDLVSWYKNSVMSFGSRYISYLSWIFGGWARHLGKLDGLFGLWYCLAKLGYLYDNLVKSLKRKGKQKRTGFKDLPLLMGYASLEIGPAEMYQDGGKSGNLDCTFLPKLEG